MGELGMRTAKRTIQPTFAAGTQLNAGTAMTVIHGSENDMQTDP